MKISEMDDQDRSFYQTKNDKNNSFDKDFSDTLEDYEYIKSVMPDLMKIQKGRDALKSQLGDLLSKIVDLYDFCNQAKQDDETKNFKERLNQLYFETEKLFDEL